MKKSILILLAVLLVMISCQKRGNKDGWRIENSVLYIETQDAFEKWMEYREKCITNGTFETDINLAVVAIVLREGVQSVPDSAFCDMDKVEHVSLPNSLKVIGEEAFCGCLSLQEITIPPNVEEMYDGAFLLCESLTEITIPPKIERLRAYVLSGCTGLKEIRVPKTVKWIEEEALLAEGAQRLVFEGTIDVIDNLMTYRMPDLSQVVFCESPPGVYEYDHKEAIWPYGLAFLNGSDATIYYLNTNKEYWKEFGEQWLGCPLVGIDSLDDLPPLK